MTTLLAAVAPTSARPTRAASSEATWRVLRKTSTPRRKVRWSSKVAAVASLGMPSKKSKSPSRVDTRSGVMILAGISVLKFGVLATEAASHMNDPGLFVPAPPEGSDERLSGVGLREDVFGCLDVRQGRGAIDLVSQAFRLKYRHSLPLGRVAFFRAFQPPGLVDPSPQSFRG